MFQIKKEHVFIGCMALIALLLASKNLRTSPPERNLTAPSSPSRELSSELKACTQQDNKELFCISLGSVLQSNDSDSSSPEQDCEDDMLADTALSCAPKHLTSKMDDLKPFIKLLLRSKRSSPIHESENVLEVLKRVSSKQQLPTSSSATNASGSIEDHHESNEPSHSEISTEAQKERFYLQQILLEASQQALEAKEIELKHRAKLLHDKEKKLDEKFSKKATAAIAAVFSLVTTLAGTLTAYYSSTKK